MNKTPGFRMINVFDTNGVTHYIRADLIESINSEEFMQDEDGKDQTQAVIDSAGLGERAEIVLTSGKRLHIDPSQLTDILDAMEQA